MKKKEVKTDNNKPHPLFLKAATLIVDRFKKPFIFIEFMSDLINCYVESKIERIAVPATTENVVFDLHFFQNVFIKEWIIGDKDMIEKMAQEMGMITDLQEPESTYYIMSKALAALALARLNYGIHRESHNRAIASMQTLFEVIFLINLVEQEQKSHKEKK